MPLKSNKTISANSKGIVVSFTDVNRNTYIPYSNKYVIEKQLEPKPKYQHIERSIFNSEQQRIYALSIYGLSVFSKEEIQKIAPEEKIKIIRNYTRIQVFLNKWKQELAETKVNNLLLSLFHNSKAIKDFCSVNGYDKEYKDCHTFKELGLTQKVIAEKLVEQKLLPRNFFELA